jgi:hypothetical protein
LAQDVDRGMRQDALEQGHGLMEGPANRAVGHESAQADVAFERFDHLLSEVVNVALKDVDEGLDPFRHLAAVCRGRQNDLSQRLAYLIDHVPASTMYVQNYSEGHDLGLVVWSETVRRALLCC